MKEQPNPEPAEELEPLDEWEKRERVDAKANGIDFVAVPVTAVRDRIAAERAKLLREVVAIMKENIRDEMLDTTDCLHDVRDLAKRMGVKL